jgi:hypothetical protein
MLFTSEGRRVHEWAYLQGRSWHYAEMLPNGNLVAIDKNHSILELDWNSNLVWKFDTKAHHDFARLPNGHTYVVSGRKLDAPNLHPDKPLFCDTILEVTQEGETVWEWAAEEHLEELRQLTTLILPVEKFNDWPHINTVEVLPDSPAAQHDARFAAGNLLVCGRHIDTIWVIERETGAVVWAWGFGELLGPHMPTMLPDGHILVYDNGQNSSTQTRGYSRVIEMDPLTGEITWQYTGTPPDSFYSSSRGSSQRMPNDNILIAESNSGRLFEVTREGRIVWEFLNPVLAKGRRDAVYRVVGYPRDTVVAIIESND